MLGTARSATSHRASLSVACAVLAVALPRGQDAGIVRTAREAAWQAIVADWREQNRAHHVVGASLMFVANGAIVGSAFWGDADRESKRAVDADTIFHWASITKTLTGIAVMQLRDRGRIALDDRIVDHLPELRRIHDPERALGQVTLAHLLSHSAGFRGATWPWGGGEPWHPHEPTDWSQLVAMLPYTRLEFAPGSRFGYSNPGIVFLGRVVEQQSGDDFEVYMDKNVLRPLDMRRSYYDTTPYHLLGDRSNSYRVEGSETVAYGIDFDTGITTSNGGLNAPLTDMVRYLAFLTGDVAPDGDAARVLARSSLEEMWQPRLPAGGGQSIGLTFFVLERGGRRVLGHTGGQRGFVSFFWVHPPTHTAAIGAFNTSTAGPVMERVRSRLIEEMTPLYEGGDGRPVR